MNNSQKIGLIELALKEWDNGELESKQALWNIAVVVGIRPPSPECKKWAEKAYCDYIKKTDKIL